VTVANSWQITVSGDWINTSATPAPALNGFEACAGTVIFDKPSGIIYIWGSNTWYVFSCTISQITIAFEQGRTQTIANVAGSTFRVKGLPPALPLPYPNGIVLTGFTPPATIPPAAQWIFTLNPVAVLDMAYVTVDWSFATPYNITTPPNVNPRTNCTNWLNTILVIADMTEDRDGNGKIERIRVRAQAILNDNFSDFAVQVQGYTLASPAYVANDAALTHDEFWIMLKEKPALDTDAAPRWFITRNNSLLDSATGIFLLKQSSPAIGEVPMDGAAPIIGYTLAVAGKNQIFVHFSEPVVKAAGGIIDATDFTYTGAETITGLTRITTSGNGTSEALLTLSAGLTAAEAMAPVTITVSALRDEEPVPTWPSWPVPGWPVPPNPIPAGAARTHRVTDVGLGLVGNGVLEPVWARDQTLRDPTRGGVGLITVFDGSGWLQRQDITLEAHIDNSIASNPTATLWFDVNVPAANLLNRLWLPPFTTSAYNGLVPYADPAARSASGSSPTTQLRDFLIPHTDSELADGAVVQIIFELVSGPQRLYCARLPNPNAADWYRNVQPWEITIHDIVQQRANVTITNNVINPDRGERTNLTYVMTAAGKVTITVFDLKGDVITVLYSGDQTAGEHSTSWDGKNRGGRVVARGIYFIRAVGPGFDEFRKVLIVR
jgi:hypothetical protein